MHKFRYPIIIPAMLFLLVVILLPTKKVQAGQIVGPEYPYHPIEVNTEFAGGTGTKEDPYLISDADQLELYRNYYGPFGTNTNYFALTNDIFINSKYKSYTKWKKTAPVHKLSPANGYLNNSSFDGRGHTIYGIYTDGASFLPSGMIEAEIKNVNFSHFYCKNAPLLALAFSGTYAGNIKISDGIILYDKSLDRRAYGGVFGEADYYLDNPQTLENINIDAKMTINQTGDIGLIAGRAYSTDIKNCSASGSISYTQTDNSQAWLGGLFGQCNDIRKCTNNADIVISLPKMNAVLGSFGGVAGYLSGMGVIDTSNSSGGYDTYPVSADGCKNTGAITIKTKYTLKYAQENKLTRQYYNVGGVVGTTGKHASIKNCVNEGDISSAFGNYIAGIAAEIKGDINNCLNTGNITGDSDYCLSGIVSKSNGNIIHCENRGNISSHEQMTDKAVFFVSANVAGIVSAVLPSDGGQSLQIKYCKNSGNLSADDASQWTSVAGIASTISYDIQDRKPASVSLSYCYNTGDLYGPVLGGIAATSKGAKGNSYTIKYCVNAGTIYEPFNDDRFDGIVFFAECTNLAYCYNLGQMTSDYSKYRERAAQIVGMAVDAVTIKKCYMLDSKANPIAGTGIGFSGSAVPVVTRKTKTELLNSKTVKKIIKNAGWKKP